MHLADCMQSQQRDTHTITSVHVSVVALWADQLTIEHKTPAQLLNCSERKLNSEREFNFARVNTDNARPRKNKDFYK